MKVGCLISGGKDSWYAAFQVSKKYELSCLITIKAKRADSYMFHVPNIDLVKKQVECTNIPLIDMPSSGVKEEELEDLKNAIELAKIQYKIEGVVAGALKSNYQKERIEKICGELGLELIAPLWGKDEDYYMHELLLSRFDTIIVGVAADGLGESWLGRKIDARTLQDLRKIKRLKRISIMGEGGEYETFVLDCPLFKKRIKVIESEKKMDGEFSGVLKIKSVEVVEK